MDVSIDTITDNPAIVFASATEAEDRKKVMHKAPGEEQERLQAEPPARGYIADKLSLLLGGARTMLRRLFVASTDDHQTPASQPVVTTFEHAGGSESPQRASQPPGRTGLGHQAEPGWEHVPSVHLHSEQAHSEPVPLARKLANHVEHLVQEASSFSETPAMHEMTSALDEERTSHTAGELTLNEMQHK